MAYEWQPHECNWQVTNERFPKGVPYSKLANVTLEKDGELKTFLTQEATDAAWVDGWHEPGRPETVDVAPEPVVEKIEKVERLERGIWPAEKRGPGRPRKNG